MKREFEIGISVAIRNMMPTVHHENGRVESAAQCCSWASTACVADFDPCDYEGIISEQEIAHLTWLVSEFSELVAPYDTKENLPVPEAAAVRGKEIICEIAKIIKLVDTSKVRPLPFLGQPCQNEKRY